MSGLRWGVFAVAMLAAGGAHAECGASASEEDVKQCMAQDLRDSDKRINAVYKSLSDALDDTGKLALRDEQRAWLKTRTKACDLDNKESDSEKWLQAIIADEGKTVCVVRYTFDRVAQLDSLAKAKAPSAPGADLPAAPQAPQLTPTPVAAGAQAAPPPIGLAYIDEGYKAVSSKSHRQGKWYYEMWIDRDGLAKLGDLLLSQGFIGEGTSGIMRMINVRRTHVGTAPVALAFALDLDNGFCFIRQNGAWNFQPGSVGAPEIKLNHEFRTSLEGSSEVRELIRRGLIKVNLGDRPFEYALPEGYRPFVE